jgi:hypothetical protein
MNIAFVNLAENIIAIRLTSLHDISFLELQQYLVKDLQISSSRRTSTNPWFGVLFINRVIRFDLLWNWILSYVDVHKSSLFRHNFSCYGTPL